MASTFQKYINRLLVNLVSDSQNQRIDVQLVCEIKMMFSRHLEIEISPFLTALKIISTCLYCQSFHDHLMKNNVLMRV